MLVSVYQSLQATNAAAAEISYRLTGEIAIEGQPPALITGLVAQSDLNPAAINAALLVNDRFGRVYRIVDDESRASHAGHSVWARGDDVYLDLNSAFLGVAFESRWDGGQTLPITRAQLMAGRNLTNYLRQRFAIAPEMCVTHGLTSVSPKNYLIGYHHDWARGFPFAAFGLPDLYAQPPPSVALFGFNYDREFVRVVGERWPGLVAAEAALRSDASARHVSTDVVRLERRALYNKWVGQIRDDATVAGESSVQPVAANR